ncbi:MAG: site-2 protease family protein [Bacteroidetes bacterium]|nr:site-2 protease family protein [Bacteroidota bacterium]MBS1541528.1 site-2 protease family protein [Bacteroidota bacterium]
MNARVKSFLIHGSLFIVTFITTTLAGAEWTNGKSIFYTPNFSWDDFAGGLPYSICFLTILSCHEFGHYFTAIYYRIKTTLPYYIPLIPLPGFGLTIGTFGALIRIKERILSNKQQFDVGIAGPLAGFVVALVFLIYGFLTLPPPEYVFQFHPEYQQYGLDYAAHVYNPATMPAGVVDVVIGKNLLFSILEKLFADPARMPNAHEIMHYPFLFAGFLSLVFTSLNLLPIGQLDGGHVLYGLAGYKKHNIIATVIYVPLLFYCGLGFIDIRWPLDNLIIISAAYLFALYRVMFNFFSKKRDRLMYALLIFAAQYMLSWLYPALQGYTTWLLFILLIGAMVGVKHPPSLIEEPLSRTRKTLGWLALLIFILCLTPNPIELVQSAATATP